MTIKLVIYTCVPLMSRTGYFRRMRIVVEGTKVTSTCVSPTSIDHHSCCHRSTIHRYLRGSDILPNGSSYLYPTDSDGLDP